MSQVKDYRKFSNRVCSVKEAGFIGVGFIVAAVIVGSIILGIYFGTQCEEGHLPCNDGYTCVPASSFCNGIHDCPIGEDEWRCYPREFYVAFRANKKISAFSGLFPAKNDTIVLVNNTNPETIQFQISQDFSEKVRKALEKNLQHPLNETGAVNVFRFRTVNESGHPTNQSDENDFLAVDILLTFAIGRLVPIGKKNNATKDIKDALRILGDTDATEAIFDDVGDGVTTGVGVVLSGPDTCNRPKVYCNIDCGAIGKAHKYGTTKGCPEYPCSCADE